MLKYRLKNLQLRKPIFAQNINTFFKNVNQLIVHSSGDLKSFAATQISVKNKQLKPGGKCFDAVKINYNVKLKIR